MISNTTLVGGGLAVIGILLVSEGASAKTVPSVAKKETVAGIVIAVTGLATVTYSLMARTRRA